jgi:hypothetical protein
MRVYSLALGILVTIGYGCVAKMAVAGARPPHESPPAAARDTVWWGGTLAPVTVEAERPPRSPARATWT